MLPELTVNRHFMTEFVAAAVPCAALGMVDVQNCRCALIALRLSRPIPQVVLDTGFVLDHALLSAGELNDTHAGEVLHFAFEFYDFATCDMLINPNNPVARSVLGRMVGTGGYIFFALDSNRGVTAFQSAIGRDNPAGLKANLARIHKSTTTEAQYCTAVAGFTKHPEPPGCLLTWVCRDNASALDPAQDRLVLRPT